MASPDPAPTHHCLRISSSLGTTHSWVRELTLLPFDWSQCPTFLADMHGHLHRLNSHPDCPGLQEMLQKPKDLHSDYIDEAGKHGGQDQSAQQSVSGPSSTTRKTKSLWTKPSKDRILLCLLPRLAQNKGRFSTT